MENRIDWIKSLFFILVVFATQTLLDANLSYPTAKKVLKSVVKINVKRSAQHTMLQPETSFMQFTSKPEKEDTEHVYGSGFVVTKDGYITTTLHVLKEEGASIKEISVTTNDGKVFPAKIVGYDKFLDVLVLKIAANNLTPISWGDSSKVVPTQAAYAFGHPLKLDNTIIRCFVSSVNRDISKNEFVSAAQTFPEGVTRNVIQLDGNFQPGLSGSPVTNHAGQIIGMTSSNFGHHENGVGVGIGFCLPVNALKPIVNKIIATKSNIARAELGVQGIDLDEKITKARGLKEIKGVLIVEVYSNSSAASAKIEADDIILSINGQLITNSKDLRYIVKTLPLNKKLPLEVLRDGKILKLTISLMPAQDNEEFIHLTTNHKNKADNISSALGLSIVNLTPENALEHGFPKHTKGVLITSFKPKNIAAVETTLKAGDLLEAIDNTPVANVAEAEKLLQSSLASRRQSVLLLINRPEGKKFEPLVLN